MRERLERNEQPMLKQTALVVRPPLEFRCRCETKAVEKRSDVDGNRAGRVAFEECVVELVDVGPNDVAIEAQILGAEDGVVASEVAAEGVEGLGYDAPALIFVGVGPQE
jgi:hypothetical protein